MSKCESFAFSFEGYRGARQLAMIFIRICQHLPVSAAEPPPPTDGPLVGDLLAVQVYGRALDREAPGAGFPEQDLSRDSCRSMGRNPAYVDIDA